MWKILFILSLLSFSSLAWAGPRVVDGSIDLSELDESSTQIMPLEGVWHFYWQHLIGEDDLRQGFLERASPIPVTSHGPNWLQILAIGQKHGYGTYVLRIQGWKAAAGSFALQMSQFFGTHRVAVWQPSQGIYRELGGRGMPAESREKQQPVYGMSLGVIDIPSDGSDLFVLIQYSEYYMVGSYVDAPILGRSDILKSKVEYDWALACWVLGLFTMMILFNFCLFLLRRTDIPSLTIAVLTFINSVRFICTEGMISQLIEHPPRWIYPFTTYAVGWVFPLAFACYFSFLRYSFPRFFSKFMHRLCLVTVLAYILMTIVMDVSPIPAIIISGLIFFSLTNYMLVQQIRAVRHGVKGSGFAIIGVWVLILGVGHDTLVFLKILHSPYLGQYAMILFTLLQSLVVARNFTYAFKTAQRLSTQLKEEVDLQTAQLQEQNALLALQKAEIAKAHELQQNWNNYLRDQVLQRFLPPGIAGAVAQGKITLFEAPMAVDATVIFADLCAFTRATERLGAETIGFILNRYFVSMTEIVFSEGGMVDKFIGDGIMAVFGVPNDVPAAEQVQHALRCAARMQLKLEELNAEWLAQYQYSFSMRIGVHRGPAVFGSFGGKQRSDYTVIGSAVNVASRIEAIAAPNSIYISSAILEFLKHHQVHEAGVFQLKGLDAPVRLYEIKDFKAVADDACFLETA
jgi:class 3 adenylate cyclase